LPQCGGEAFSVSLKFDGDICCVKMLRPYGIYSTYFIFAVILPQCGGEAFSVSLVFEGDICFMKMLRPYGIYSTYFMFAVILIRYCLVPAFVTYQPARNVLYSAALTARDRSVDPFRSKQHGHSLRKDYASRLNTWASIERNEILHCCCR